MAAGASLPEDRVTIALAAGAVVGGLVALMVAADLFVGAAEGIALHRRWSPAVIGAVVVGFGTSLPELVTSAVAAFAREPDLAIGNAAGSNVANLLLILGVAAVIAPIRGSGRGPGRDITIAAGAGLLLCGLAVSGELGLLDGVVLVVALAFGVLWQVRSARSAPIGGALDATLSGAADMRGQGLAWRAIGGLVGVIAGAQLLVWGATVIATEAGVPAIVIGSVLVAIGTSLPELATAVASARRGQTELLLGNLVGSNAFNALGVVGAAALIGAARGEALAVDRAALAVVVAGGIVTLTIGLWLWRSPRVGRLVGLGLVAAYVAAVPLLASIS